MTVIICGGQYAEVREVKDHAAHSHPHSPIANDLPAREWVTDRGSRWSGVRPDGTAFVDPTRGARAMGVNSDESSRNSQSEGAAQ